MLDEGLDGGLGPARARAAGCCRQGLEKLGLELVAPAGHRLPQLTTVWVPEDLPAGHGRGRLSRAPCCTATASRSAPGRGQWPGRVWRIGCMGHTARPRNVELLLGALGEVLGR